MQARILQAFAAHRAVTDAVASSLAAEIEALARRAVSCLRGGGKILAFGNGGSAADAQHFVAELVGRFRRERPGLPALALTVDPSVVTAVANDFGFDRVFARQVEAHARQGDLALGLSTSGRSQNVRRGLVAARTCGAATAALLGGDGGEMRDEADLVLVVPSADTARVQEAHMTILHVVCELVDEEMAG